LGTLSNATVTLGRIVQRLLIDVFTQMLATRLCSVDQILVDPILRSEFLHNAWASLPDRSERELLRGLVRLRRRGKLPRRIDFIPW
jgi:hypothetical protein